MTRSALPSLLCVLVLGPRMLFAAEPAALGPAPAQVPTPVELEHLKVCMQEQNDARRLMCYDQALERPRGQSADLGMTPELLRRKQAQVGVAAPPAKEKISARVTKVTLQANGRFVATLDSGQVWLQTETLDFPIQAGSAVEIGPGLFGGIWLTLPSRKIKTHVKRIE